jgi:DNA-binding CsgD family transcriptional regulator
MPHLILAFYLVAALTGAFSISQAFMTWQRYRKPVIRRYAYFLVSLLLILLGFLVDLYSRIAGLSADATARALVWILQAGGGTLYIVISPYLFHSLAGRSVPPWQRWSFFGLDAAVVLAALANLAFPGVAAIPVALAGALFSMIAYGLIYTLVRLAGIGEPTLRRSLVIFLCLSALFFPLMVLDVVMSETGFLGALQFLNNLAQPAYFLALTSLSIVFGVRYLNRPAYREHGRLTDYFLSAFGVTPREAEIIAQLVEGANLKGIGRKLFISPKTAENHVSSIYRKLGVRNRLQMFQMLTTNSIE